MDINRYPEGHVILAEPVQLADFARDYINLASAGLGSQVVAVSDEWFAPANRMLADSDPVFIVGKFDDHGKWMDGWETRRKRVEGYDYAVIKLGLCGHIYGIDIDTSHFTGNYPPAASVEACYCDSAELTGHETWHCLVADAALHSSQHHFFSVDTDTVFTHIRLNIYPDGGIARCRVYGQPQGSWHQQQSTEQLYEFSSVYEGGRVVAVSDAHFGLPSALLYPNRGSNMGNGWETRRRRVPGYEWCIVQLAHACVIEKLEIDTCHFKGNYPDRAGVQAANVDFGTPKSLVTQAMFWPVLLTPQALQMDHQHFYATNELAAIGKVTHVKLNIYPDGGVSRFRVWGRLVD